MKNWREIIKEDVRYKDFILLDEPIAFCEMFTNQNIPCVQLHSMQTFGDENEQDVIGFCGCFKWNDNNITSLDGDTYTKDTTIYGYSWFTNKNEKCLNILVGEEW